VPATELDFLIEKLTGDSVRAVETAITSFKTASQAIRTHNQQLKQAMEVPYDFINESYSNNLFYGFVIFDHFKSICLLVSRSII